jgi:Glutamyl-tRNAGlu reductase, N-terminal domain
MQTWSTGWNLILLLIISCDFTIGLNSLKIDNLSKNTNTLLDRNVYLLSLKWPSERAFSKPVKDLWRWKDSVLGDGRDFFIPRPKTLMALNRYIIESCPGIQECVVLSNCARLELLLLTSDGNANDLEWKISRALIAQMISHQNRPMKWQDSFVKFDSPSSIFSYKSLAPIKLTSNNNKESDNEHNNNNRYHDDMDIQQIKSHWMCYSGVESVCRHLCLVASGLASRPNRPDPNAAVVSFRPFSSRDAHILWQLKKTPVNDGTTLSLLLEMARSAGKVARDPRRIPVLEGLRRQYGTGDNSKYSMDPPASVLVPIIQTVHEIAIEPTVLSCLERWDARYQADVIACLRGQALQLGVTDSEQKWIRQELHGPTMELRRGRYLDVSALLVDLEERLNLRRGE